MSFIAVLDPEPHRCRNYRQGAGTDGYQRPFRCTLTEGHDSRCEFGVAQASVSLIRADLSQSTTFTVSAS